MFGVTQALISFTRWPSEMRGPSGPSNGRSGTLIWWAPPWMKNRKHSLFCSVIPSICPLKCCCDLSFEMLLQSFDYICIWGNGSNHSKIFQLEGFWSRPESMVGCIRQMVWNMDDQLICSIQRHRDLSPNNSNISLKMRNYIILQHCFRHWPPTLLNSVHSAAF